MPVSIVSAVRELRSLLAGFEAGAFSGADCAQLVEELSATEKACAGARVLAARRAVECKAYERNGFTDPADWLATQSGITASEARRNLNTAGQFGERTKDALLAGKLSLDQAEEITTTEKEAPGSEEELVGLAPRTDLSQLRQAARDARHKATDPVDLHERQRKARTFRWWRDQLGMTCFRGALPPGEGVRLVNRLERATKKLYDQAKHDSRQDPGSKLEPWDAYAADAFIELTSDTGGKRRSGQTDLVIVCDLRAWRRGHAHEGEPCHILDGGPIPVEIAKQLCKDAFLSVAFHDGVDLSRLTRMGRHIPAHLRAALDIGDPPDFTGKKCADCGKRHSLQIDHVDPVANNGPTSLDNLQPRCYSDHQAKTERDRKAGLLRPRSKRSSISGAGPDPPSG